MNDCLGAAGDGFTRYAKQSPPAAPPCLPLNSFSFSSWMSYPSINVPLQVCPSVAGCMPVIHSALELCLHPRFRCLYLTPEHLDSISDWLLVPASLQCRPWEAWARLVSLLPTWEALIEFHAPGFGLAQPWLLMTFKSESADENTLSVHSRCALSLSQMIN